MIWGDIVSVYIEIVHGETSRPRTTVMRVQDNEVDYMFANLALWIMVLRFHSDMLPRHQPYVCHLNMMCPHYMSVPGTKDFTAHSPKYARTSTNRRMHSHQA